MIKHAAGGHSPGELFGDDEVIVAVGWTGRIPIILAFGAGGLRHLVDVDRLTVPLKDVIVAMKDITSTADVLSKWATEERSC